jgi:hypothetical protein
MGLPLPTESDILDALQPVIDPEFGDPSRLALR